MNPKKLGRLANNRQEPWKAPLPQFSDRLYERSFGRSRPEQVVTIEERAQIIASKKAVRKQAKAERRAAAAEGSPPDGE